MSNEFESMNTVPSLTLEPELEEKQELTVKEEAAPVAEPIQQPVLTEQEQKMVSDFAAKIDLENTTQILQYGAAAQKKMADFSDAALANVKTQDLGEVGDLIVNVVGELQGFDKEELEATAQRTGLAEDAQAARDLAEKCNRFEKKIYDLELTRTISIQTAPQIRMIQNNDTVMVEKIQTTLVNTIPLWKNQMVLALGIAHSTEAAQAQRQVNDVTNALLKHNAEKLHMASVETAKEAERGIVDIETLKKTNADLIQTLDDVMKIQSDGRAQRMAAEAEMAKMEEQLKTKLLQIRSEKQG